MKNQHGIRRVVVALIFMWFTPCLAGTSVQYVYDDLNRLVWEKYGNGRITVYEQHEVGNHIGRYAVPNLLCANYGASGVWT